MNDHRVGADVDLLNNAAVQTETMPKHLLYELKVKCYHTHGSCSRSTEGWKHLNVLRLCFYFRLFFTGEFQFPLMMDVEELNNNLRLRCRNLCFEDELYTDD